MSEVTTRPIDGNGHTPDPPKTARPSRPSRHYSKITGQYSVELDYAGLTSIISDLDTIWEIVEETFPLGESIALMFVALLDRLADLREWTGWAGVPGIYTGEVAK